MLTANWGRGGKSPLDGLYIHIHTPGRVDDPTIDDLELSPRVSNALRGNYHGWYEGRRYEGLCADCGDPDELPAPPLSWLRGIMAKPKMWRKLHNVGKKGYDEIEAELERFDGCDYAF
jgi:hypothetical protein